MIIDRLIKIIDRRLPKKRAFKALEEQTGISAQQWNHLYHGRTSPDAKHIEALAGLYPEYAYWIISGKTMPEAGQTSPDLEQLEELKKTVGL